MKMRVTPRLGRWKLSELKDVPQNGLTVFSMFCCGGGSTMGWKLAGYSVLGGVEIDPKIAAIYQANHKPKFFYNEPIQSFRKRADLPKELLSLDVLDGSPPCSSFSMAGSREKTWGKQKKFREGQAEQILDDLFFHFIGVAERLRPRVVVAENVKGLVIGNAKGYVKEIFSGFDKIGYDLQLFLLDASRMGVPQRRQRTFFIARRKDLNIPAFEFAFDEVQISAREALEGRATDGKPLSEEQAAYWRKTPRGKSLSVAHPKGNMFTWQKLDPRTPAPTIVSGPATLHWDSPRHISDDETRALQTFPEDYDFMGNSVRYICGMSVPPFMMQRVALRVADAISR